MGTWNKPHYAKILLNVEESKKIWKILDCKCSPFHSQISPKGFSASKLGIEYFQNLGNSLGILLKFFVEFFGKLFENFKNDEMEDIPNLRLFSYFHPNTPVNWGKLNI